MSGNLVRASKFKKLLESSRDLQRFQKDQKVYVKTGSLSSPTRRTPFYVRGRAGVIDYCYGETVDAEFNYDHRISWGPLYRVAIRWSELYPEKPEQNSLVYVDLHESWLEPIQSLTT